MIGDHMVVMADDDDSVEITQGKKAREEKPTAPEGVRDPVV